MPAMSLSTHRLTVFWLGSLPTLQLFFSAEHGIGLVYGEIFLYRSLWCLRGGGCVDRSMAPAVARGRGWSRHDEASKRAEAGQLKIKDQCKMIFPSAQRSVERSWAWSRGTGALWSSDASTERLSAQNACGTLWPWRQRRAPCTEVHGAVDT